jgi:hypothetical protein
VCTGNGTLTQDLHILTIPKWITIVIIFYSLSCFYILCWGRVKEKQRLENKVKAMSEELMKGNEIIKKLQGEIKNYHAKVPYLSY